MKKCNRCEEEKPYNCFHKNKHKSDGLQGQCKECKKKTDAVHFQKNKEKQNERNRINRAKYKTKYQKLKNNPCADCGEIYPPYVMDFDHIDNKINNVSQILNRYSWDTLLAEIEKCELVCANCHRERTHSRLLASEALR